MYVSETEVPQLRRVAQALEDGVHETLSNGIRERKRETIRKHKGASKDVKECVCAFLKP